MALLPQNTMWFCGIAPSEHNMVLWQCSFRTQCGSVALLPQNTMWFCGIAHSEHRVVLWHLLPQNTMWFCGICSPRTQCGSVALLAQNTMWLYGIQGSHATGKTGKVREIEYCAPGPGKVLKLDKCGQSPGKETHPEFLIQMIIIISSSSEFASGHLHFDGLCLVT